MFRQFRIQHVTSSPYNPRSNGHAEASIREAKRLVVQHKYESAEFFKALLGRRNATAPSRGAAPARLVLGRLLHHGGLPLPDRDIFELLGFD